MQRLERWRGGEAIQELARLRRENARLQARLSQAETIIEIQKKVALLLGTQAPLMTDEP